MEIKNLAMKNRINHQNNFICFRKIYNNMSNCDCQKNIKKLIGGELLITTVASTVVVMIFGLRVVGVGQQGVLLMSTFLVHWLSLPVFRYDDKKPIQ